VLEEKDKPVLDESTLGRLLEAAFVVQEHNRALQALGLRVEHQRPAAVQVRPVSIPPESKPETSQPAPPAKDDYAFTLAQIVETQHQIQVRHLELDSAIALVAERAIEIAHAAGAAIGIVEGKGVRYKAAAGVMNLPVGSEIPLEKALSLECLRTGQVVRCTDVGTGSVLDAEDCRRRGIQAMIAVPVYHNGGIVGALEVYYSSEHAFAEQDVHTCQLMAGLVTEALARSEELSWKQSLASERAVMLEALEKLKPNLAALVDTPAVEEPGSKTVVPATASPASLCRKCGHALVGAEQFCGQCGLPRSDDYEPPTMQSKVASLWHMQLALQKNTIRPPANGASVQASGGEDRPEKALPDSFEEEMPELLAALGIQREPLLAEFAKPVTNSEISGSEISGSETTGSEIDGTADLNLDFPTETSEESNDEDSSPADATLAKREPAYPWSSAASARAFLEQVAAARPSSALTRFWKARRGDFYLAIAVILVACVIRWGIWSSHSVSATGNPATAAAAHHKPAPNADLSLFDRMLVSLGIAEPPEPVEYKGNPETQVWVDLHTALYYCPGTDLYGKTPKGKFTTQRDAQLDQFEPAYRKACD
jgi:GAF domain-containing protein